MVADVGRTFSVVIESENLGMADLDELEASLESLQRQGPLTRANEVLLVAGGHLSRAQVEDLQRRYPWLTVHRSERPLEYTEAKVRGAELVTGEIVVFADCDMRYEPTWLAGLLDVLDTIPEADVAAGDTRVETISSYTMALNLMWMVRILEPLSRPMEVRDFSLNNFAMRRDLFVAVPFPDELPVYRGKVPVWRDRLLRRGSRIFRAPGGRGHHMPPSGVRDWAYRMLIFGHDPVAASDFTFEDDGRIVERRSIARRLYTLTQWSRWLARQVVTRGRALVREDPRNARWLALGLPLCAANIALVLAGGLVTCFDRDVLLTKIRAREAQGGADDRARERAA